MAEATIRDPLRCGSCGNAKFSLYNVRKPDEVRAGGGPSVSGTVEVECLICGDVSVLSTTQAELKLEPREGSQGSVCGGWHSS